MRFATASRNPAPVPAIGARDGNHQATRRPAVANPAEAKASGLTPSPADIQAITDGGTHRSATGPRRSGCRPSSEREDDIRRALAYVLNLDDEALVAITTPMHIRMRQRASDRRRFLEMLWEATFASWKVKDFDPTEYELA